LVNLVKLILLKEIIINNNNNIIIIIMSEIWNNFKQDEGVKQAMLIN